MNQFQNLFIQHRITYCIQHRFGEKKMSYKVCGVYNAEKIAEEKYYFKLTDCGDNAVLSVVNQDGEEIAVILMISKKTGVVTRFDSVSEKIGFDLDLWGRVKVV